MELRSPVAQLTVVLAGMDPTRIFSRGSSPRVVALRSCGLRGFRPKKTRHESDRFQGRQLQPPIAKE